MSDNAEISAKSDIIPLFTTSASRRQGGIFTAEKAGERAKQKRLRGPRSLCDIAAELKLPKMFVVGSNMIDFMSLHRNLDKIGCELHYGYKVVVCENVADKTENSQKTESSVIIWMAGDGTTDYQKLIDLVTFAGNEGFYYIPRLDWKTLKERWHESLVLSLPYYSSFLAKNTLTFSAIVPELPAGITPLVLREVDAQLPFDELIDHAVDTYVGKTGAKTQQVKTIYYWDRASAKPWQIWQCIIRRTDWDKPKMEGCCSREFCYEAWKELAAK